jgi:hypothetical protein
VEVIDQNSGATSTREAPGVTCRSNDMQGICSVGTRQPDGEVFVYCIFFTYFAFRGEIENENILFTRRKVLAEENG